VVLHRRELVWDGCLNVRDLGGHPTIDGGETRYGAVVRADSVRQLSDAGWAALVDYGVKTIVDLRMDEELAEDPPADVPVDVVHVPFLVSDPEVQAEAEALGAAAPDDTIATRDVYLLFLERFRANVARAIRVVAHAPDGAVAVHCQGGKDRTGLVSALLLRLAGVADGEIGADYALSSERLQPRHEAWLAEAESEAERERLRRVFHGAAEAMVGVLEEIDRRYGSVEDYLRAGGLDDDELERARARLRD
jgi:protein tyrosine/serine phosphatase